VGDLVVPLVALGTAASCFLLGVGVLVLRRYLMGRGFGSFDCSIHDPFRRRGSGAWVLGMARYEADRLDWFRIFALTPRPDKSWIRSDLTILDHRDLAGVEVHAVLPGWAIVRCEYRGTVLELAMSKAAYDGFATWLESGPPGVNISVT
jgi:hypothetical protein